jgi:hypothetical protein
MSALCLAAALAVATVPTERFTLAWTHSVEKVRWEEDYLVRREGLVLVEARVRGNGAGMEIPEGAQFRGGAWHYRPRLAPLARLRLARSEFAGDYEICRDGRCTPLARLLPAPSDTVELYPCP